MNKEGAAHDGLSPDKVPRSACALLQRVIGTVKSSATRLAVYLRGWDTLRKFSAGSAQDPPACSTCIIAAIKRGAKEAPPPRLGLFPCMPMSEMGDSPEDRYVNFLS